MSDNETRVGSSRMDAFGDAAQSYASRSGIQTSGPKDIGIDIPIESVPLPSQGKIYPIGSFLHMRETIDIKPMTATEEDILMSRALVRNGTVLSELIRSCITNKDVEIDKLLVGDRESILVSIRITGYGTKYVTNVSCGSCNNRMDQEFDLSTLMINTLNIDPMEVGSNEFEFMLPISKKKITFKFMTVEDERNIIVSSDRKQKSGLKIENSVTDKLKSLILSIDGKYDKSLISHFVRNMPAMDSYTLRNYINDSEPGLDLSIKFKCSECDYMNNSKLPIGINFFWPSRRG